MKRTLMILTCLIALAAATQSVFALCLGKASIHVLQNKGGDSPGP